MNDVGSPSDPVPNIYATRVYEQGQRLARLDGAAFTGAITIPTPSGSDNSTKASTTAWVRAFVAVALQGVSGGVSASATLTSGKLLIGAGGSAVSATNVALAELARLAGATFTGLIHGVAPEAGDDSDKVPTTAWVQGELDNLDGGHDQGTDQYLDQGGANEVSAAALKAHLSRWLSDSGTSGSSTWSSSKIATAISSAINGLTIPSLSSVWSAVLSANLPATNQSSYVLFGSGWAQHSFLVEEDIPGNLLTLPDDESLFYNGKGNWTSPGTIHAQNKDAYLDQGGANEISAAALKALNTPPTDEVAAAGMSTTPCAWSPAKVKVAIDALAGTGEATSAAVWIPIAVFGQNENTVEGTNKRSFTVRVPFTLTEVYAEFSGAPVTGNTLVNVLLDGDNVFGSERITVATGDTENATQPTISVADFAKGSKVQIDVDQAASTPGTGLMVHLVGTLA